MTGKPQRHPVPGESDNPQDLVGVGLRVTGHQRVTEQEPRRLSSPGEGIPDGRGIRRRRPPRRGSQEQRRRAATAAGIRRTLRGRRVSRAASLRRAAVSLRRGASTSRQRSMARGAGRDQDGACREHQAADPGHAIIINAGPRGDKGPVSASSSDALRLRLRLGLAAGPGLIPGLLEPLGQSGGGAIPPSCRIGTWHRREPCGRSRGTKTKLPAVAALRFSEWSPASPARTARRPH